MGVVVCCYSFCGFLLLSLVGCLACCWVLFLFFIGVFTFVYCWVVVFLGRGGLFLLSML